MKKLAFLMAVLALVGCSKQGGTEDQYNSNTGSSRGDTSTTSNNTYSVTPDPNTSRNIDTNLNNPSTNTPLPPQ